MKDVTHLICNSSHIVPGGTFGFLNRQYLFCHNLVSGLKLDEIHEIFKPSPVQNYKLAEYFNI